MMPTNGAGEIVETLVETDAITIERIVSLGHASPTDFWYDQPRDEWVLLLTGAAKVRFEDEASLVELKPGDCLTIPAHCRHRVEWTAPDEPTVWLAAHYPNRPSAGQPHPSNEDAATEARHTWGSHMNSAFSLAVMLSGCSLCLAAPPETPKKPVTDTYQGVAVVDDFRWLENGNDPAVKKWADAQNAYARGVLAGLPGVATLRTKLAAILGAKTITHRQLAVRGEVRFALRKQPPKQQPFLVILGTAKGTDRILLDPNETDKSGNTAIDWFVPSPDGKLVAVSLSKGGSESGDVHILDVAGGTPTDVVVPRVHGGTAGGNLAWSADGKGFYYTRYPRDQERPAADMSFYQQLYFHRIDSSAESDRYELGKGLPRIAEIQVEVASRNDGVLATVQNGDSGQFAMFLRSRDGGWKQVAEFKDGLVQAAFGPDGNLYGVSRKGAPRGKVVRISTADPDLGKATVVIPEGPDTIVTDAYLPPGEKTVLPTATRLYVTYQLGGPSTIRSFTLDGKPATAPKLPDVAALGELTAAGGDDLLFAAGTFVEPTGRYLYHAATNTTEKLPLTSPPVVDFSDIAVKREFAVSQDGTKVPVSILFPKGAKLDGTNPCLVTGYGGYGLNVEPAFRPALRVLFDHGFVVAVANLRGGGEYGETWHAAGNLTKKQNVFDDFAAVLRHLIDRKYTSPTKLAIEGGSNGGLLMGATLTQHPDLMKCVVTHVGIYDMLRVELSPNGAFNIPEFGTVKDASQFKAMYAYSPYHRVKDGTKYPSVMFLTGANDPRVDPMQSRKMTARLQAAGAGTVLLRTSGSGGHGLTTPLTEQIDQTADVYAFIFDQLGVKVTDPGKR
jgi:prolyl oligopeptidase